MCNGNKELWNCTRKKAKYAGLGYNVEDVANVNVSSYAAKHKGILPQEKAQSLATDNGYTWRTILKYFYTRESGVSYYNSEVSVGSVSIVE